MPSKTIIDSFSPSNSEGELTLPGFDLEPKTDASTSTASIKPNSSAPLFNVLEELGKGGDGVVFRAVQSSLKRDIALKKHLSSEVDESSRSRFISEAVTTAIVDHPNVVPIYDLGEGDDGHVLMSMKQVKGCTWSALLYPKTKEQIKRAEAYDKQQHIEILISVCNAISYAHSKSIAHCDLKPENIMVGQFGEVLVMDWGVAVNFSKNEEKHPSVKNAVDVRSSFGTPFYLAPELALGRGEIIGPQTDVYLLGGLLYEIFNACPPHQGNSIDELLDFAVNQTPQTLSKTVPKEAEDIYMRALKKTSSQRYPSATAFRQALEEYQSHGESRVISQVAQATAMRCNEILQSDDEQLDAQTISLYDKFAESVAGFKQALILWSDNQQAHKGLHQVRVAYANFALDNQDVGIAQSQAAELDEEQLDTWEIRANIESEIDAQARAKRLNRYARWGLGGATMALIAGLFSIIHIINQDQERSALQYANVLADSLSAFRAEYSKKVIKPLASEGILVTHEPKESGEIPFPATFSIDLANTISANETDSEVRLFSDFPFPWRARGGAQNAFERDALAALRDDPSEPYYEFVSIGEKRLLQYGKAVKLKASCVGCHNTHPLSPKTDWKEGDVRGVQTVIIPIESSFSRISALIRNLFGNQNT